MLKKAFFSFLLLTLSLSVLGSDTLRLNDNLEEICICREYVDFYEDPSAQMTLEDVLKVPSEKFIGSTAKDLMNDNVSSAYWLRFTISNECSYNKPFNIEMFDFNISEADLYIPLDKGGFRNEKAGFSYNFEDRSLYHKNLSFNIPLSEKETATFYMRFKSDKKNVLEPIVRSYNQTLKYSFRTLNSPFIKTFFKAL